jgi:hypothetical protein
MPTRRVPAKVRRALIAGFSSVLFLAAAPALADAACPSATLTKAFSQFGDPASYSLLSGGSFESGTNGWSLTGASVASGNESYNVVAGSHSLAITPTGEAVSPAFCVSVEQPSFRFFLRQTSGTWAVLNVIVRWRDSSGVTHNTTAGSLQPGTKWNASPVMQLGTMLPLWMPGSTLQAKLVFKPEAYGGAWAVDDIFIDPYSR